MMKLQAGSILKSTEKLATTYFEGAVILIVEYNENGAIGFMINKPYNRALNALEAYRHLPSFLLYQGGPVDQEHLYFIHQRPHLIAEGVLLQDEIYWGGNFAQVVDGIKSGKLTTNDVKIFVGYCGWDKGDLERELSENSWNLTTEKSWFSYNSRIEIR